MQESTSNAQLDQELSDPAHPDQELTDSQFPNTQDLFGADSSELVGGILFDSTSLHRSSTASDAEEDEKMATEAPPTTSEPQATSESVKNIFGDEEDISSLVKI